MRTKRSTTRYPVFLGEEVGRILKRIIAAGGTISRSDEDALRAGLTTESSKPTALLAVLLKQLLISEVGGPQSLTVYYLNVLNTIIDVLGTVGNPMVFAGFLHSADCLTYWDFEPGTKPEKLGLEDETAIIRLTENAPRIYMLSGLYRSSGLATDDDVVRSRNLRIRMKHTRRLVKDMKSPELWTATYVTGVSDFAVRFASSSGRSGETLEIPLGAPGILRMFASLPVAIAAQEEPTVALRNTLRQAKELL